MAFKPNRDLLNANFEGYKLSTSPLTCLNRALSGEVHQAKLKDGDFSYEHVKAFSLHNHITIDPHNECSVYWCNKDGSIQRGSYLTNTAELALGAAYKGNAPDSFNNASLVFVSRELSLFSSGSGEVNLLYTGNRAEEHEWELIKSFTLSEGSPMVIATATIAHGDPTSVQLLCVELPDPTASAPQKKQALAKTTWYSLKFKCSVEALSPPVESIRESVEGITVVTSFDSKSSPLYAAFQSHSGDGTQHLLFISETVPDLPLSKCTSDKSADVSKENSIATKEDEPSPDQEEHLGLGYASQGYEWSQSDSDVVVKFELPENITKKEIDCVISRQEMVVGFVDGTTLFRGELHEVVDTEASTWTLEGDVLEVTLEKKQSGLHWPYLHKEVENHHTQFSHEGLQEDSGEKEKGDDPPAAKRRRPLVSTELEECDSTEEDSTLYVTAQDGSLVHKASLAGRQLVFTSPSQPGHAHYFAVRHDVDAVIWLPPPVTDSFPSWSHVNTFNALGYVQASKDNRKFTVCPPNLQFAVITDCNRHIFVYAQPDEGFRGNEADEYVHTLSEKMDILGVAASNKGLVFVLTSKTLFVLKLPCDS